MSKIETRVSPGKNTNAATNHSGKPGTNKNRHCAKIVTVAAIAIGNLRRPMRSERDPHIGANRNCITEKLAISAPVCQPAASSANWSA